LGTSGAGGPAAMRGVRLAFPVNPWITLVFEVLHEYTQANVSLTQWQSVACLWLKKQ